MKIAIFGKKLDEKYYPSIQELFDRLIEAGVDVLIFKGFEKDLLGGVQVKRKFEEFSSHADLPKDVDMLISIGGDGTLLETMSLVRDTGIPILGINTGRMGFLANVSTTDIRDLVPKILEKDYELDKRTPLRLDTKESIFGEFNYALNEISVHKKDSSSMVTIHAYVRDEFLNSYWADGLIVATPTGSTAYSLSCGGPIVVPGSRNLTITPIAPHNLNVRPIVLHEAYDITLRVEGREKEFLVALDSRSAPVDSGTELRIKSAEFSVYLVKFKEQNFYHTIRNKLNWGVDRRN